MPQVITVTLNVLRVEEIRVFRDEEGNWKQEIGYTMLPETEEEEGERGGAALFDLTPQQQTAIKNFEKPFIQQIKLEEQLDHGEDWIHA